MVNTIVQERDSANNCKKVSVIGHGTGASAGIISNVSELGQLTSAHLDSVSRLVALAPCIVSNPDYNLFPGDIGSTAGLYAFSDYFFPLMVFFELDDPALITYINSVVWPVGDDELIQVPGVSIDVSKVIFEAIRSLLIDSITAYNATAPEDGIF